MVEQLNVSGRSFGISNSIRTLLSHLPPLERTRFESLLEPVPVRRGDVLFHAHQQGDSVYLSDGPLISLEQAQGVEVGLVGTEGLACWQLLLGLAASPFTGTICGRDGVVMRLSMNVALRQLSSNPLIARTLNHLAHVSSLQMADTIGALASHRMDVRLARWILLRHDRVSGDVILVQHDEIARNLGARRASITDCLHVIEGQGIVRCHRGRLIVRCRRSLERIAERCFGQAENYYRDHIGSFGKSCGTEAPVAEAPLPVLEMASL